MFLILSSYFVLNYNLKISTLQAQGGLATGREAAEERSADVGGGPRERLYKIYYNKLYYNII